MLISFVYLDQCIYFLYVLQDAGNWGPQIPQRLGHILSDATPGVLMVILVSTQGFFLCSQGRISSPIPNGI